MRALTIALTLVACSSRAPAVQAPPSSPSPPAAEPTASPVANVQAEVLAADSPRTTVGGNRFVAPAGWSLAVRGPATILTPPEGDSKIALVDLPAATAEEALAAAWKVFNPQAAWPLQVSTKAPDAEGWTQITNHSYRTSPNEKRAVAAATMFANGQWTVVVIDVALATA